MITVKDFINEYDYSKNKTDFLKKHIIHEYISFEQKMSVCQNIVGNSYNIENEKYNLHKINSCLRLYNFNVWKIRLYTDIDMGKDDELLNNYNMLNSRNIFLLLDNSLPEFEVLELRNILDLSVNDDYTNNNSYLQVFDLIDNFINLISSSFNEYIKIKETQGNYE